MPSAFSRRQFVATAAAVGLISRPIAGSSNPCAGQDGEDGVVWHRTYGDDESLKVTDAVAEDDGYALVGIDRDADTSDRSWLRRVDGDGGELWRQRYGADERRSVTSVAVAADGGYLLAGSVGQRRDAQFVTRTDADGSEEWTTTVDVSGYRTFVGERDDGSVVLGVTTAYPEPKYPHVAVLDSGGEVSRSRTFDEHDGRRIRTGIVVDDGVVLAGTSDSDDVEGWLWRVAVDDRIELDRSTAVEQRVVAADRFEDGGLVLAGTNSPWLARLDSEWQVEWERTEFEPDVHVEDVTTVPGGIAVCGFRWGSGCARLPWAFRADDDGTAWNASVDESPRLRWNFVLPASEDNSVVVAGTDYDSAESDATLSLVEEPESSDEGTTPTGPDDTNRTTVEATTAADGTTTPDTPTTDGTTDGTATSDDGTAADESTADGLDGFGVAAAVAGLTTALGYRARRNPDGD
jgi:hypothetical protein